LDDREPLAVLADLGAKPPRVRHRHHRHVVVAPRELAPEMQRAMIGPDAGAVRIEHQDLHRRPEILRVAAISKGGRHGVTPYAARSSIAIWLSPSPSPSASRVSAWSMPVRCSARSDRIRQGLPRARPGAQNGDGCPLSGAVMRWIH